MAEIATGLPLLPVQARMARVALGLGVRELAELAGISTNTVARFERGEELKPGTITAIRTALEAAGVQFIAENGGGAGVRLVKRADGE
jgi:transcriptional regulator with XRE-family HTH domain